MSKRRPSSANASTDDDDEEFAEQPPAEVGGGSSRGSRGSRGCGLIGCLLVIGLLVALGAGAFALGNALEPLADRFLWAPHDVVREYLAAYESDDLERARRFLCSANRGQLLDPGAPVGERSWTAFVQDEFPYPRPGGRIAIYYGLNVPGRITPIRVQALIEREDEGWRICEFGSG